MAKRLAEFQKYKFINPDPTLRNNLMAFGFEIGDGWIPIMRELCEKIQAEIDSDPEAYKDLEFTQVKEKWGGLRVYLTYYYPKIEELVDDAEAKSFETCEICGKPGELRDRGWMSTLCNECNEKEK